MKEKKWDVARLKKLDDDYLKEREAAQKKRIDEIFTGPDKIYDDKIKQKGDKIYLDVEQVSMKDSYDFGALIDNASLLNPFYSTDDDYYNDF